MEVVKELRRCFVILIFITVIVTGQANEQKSSLKKDVPSAYPEIGELSDENLKPACVEAITCGYEPFIAKCTTCHPEYFYCKEPGASPTQLRCPPGMVFSNDLPDPKCTLEDDCRNSASISSATVHPSLISTAFPNTAEIVKQTSIPGCLDSLLCKATGNFARCNFCHMTYFFCETVGLPAKIELCYTDLLFNTDPDYPQCVPSSNCPYHPTTTELTSTVSASTTTPDCWDSLTCSGRGDFPKCVYCNKEYFHCDAEGEQGIIRQCAGIMVFNTDPDYLHCVSVSICPYHPPPTEPTVPTPPRTTYSTPPRTTTSRTTLSSSTTMPSTTQTPTTSTTSTVITSTSTVVTFAPTTTPECLDSFECPGPGDFRKCVTCRKEYFHCEKEGAMGAVKECENGLVFNPDPAFPKCIPPFNCPYHPEPTDPPAL